MSEALRRMIPRSLVPPPADAGELADPGPGLIEYCQMMTPSYEPGRVHHLLGEKLEAVEAGRIKRLIITFPPRHGKSELASIKFPSWYMGRHPSDAVIVVSYTAKLANRLSRRARNHVSDPRYPFEHVTLSGQRAAVEQWETNHGGEYNAAGIGGSVTGMGANILVIDDYLKSAEEANSPTIREDIYEWYSDTAYPRLQPSGAIIIIATRWHEDDLIGRLLKRAEDDPNADQWEVVEFQAIAEPEEGKEDPLGRKWGEALWPEKWSREELLKAKSQMSDQMWQAQYMSRPVSAAGNVFKRRDLRFWYHQGMTMMPVRSNFGPGQEYIHPQKALPPRFERQFQSWDPSVKETENGSYTVGQLWGVISVETYLIDQVRRRLDFADQLTLIRAFSSKHRQANQVLVEAKANGPAIISQLSSEIAGLKGVEPHGDKYVRAVAVTVNWEAGNILIPHPDMPGYEWVYEFIDELLKFPLHESDDQVDTMSQALADRYALGKSKGGKVRPNTPAAIQEDSDEPPRRRRRRAE